MFDPVLNLALGDIDFAGALPACLATLEANVSMVLEDLPHLIDPFPAIPNLYYFRISNVSLRFESGIDFLCNAPIEYLQLHIDNGAELLIPQAKSLG